MSIAVCECGTFVDTDDEPEAYDFGPCLCWQCREERTDEDVCAECGKADWCYSCATQGGFIPERRQV